MAVEGRSSPSLWPWCRATEDSASLDGSCRQVCNAIIAWAGFCRGSSLATAIPPCVSRIPRMLLSGYVSRPSLRNRGSALALQDSARSHDTPYINANRGQNHMGRPVRLSMRCRSDDGKSPAGHFPALERCPQSPPANLVPSLRWTRPSTRGTCQSSSRRAIEQSHVNPGKEATPQPPARHPSPSRRRATQPSPILRRSLSPKGQRSIRPGEGPWQLRKFL